MYNWLSVRDFGNDQASSDVQFSVRDCDEILAMTRHLQMYNWLSGRDFGNGQASCTDVQLA